MINNGSIVCLGDSITFGKDWLNGSDLNKPLNVRLSEKYPGIRVINLGVNSENVTQIEARKETALLYSPSKVVIWGGINDIYGLTDLSVVQSKLQTMYTYFKNLGCDVYALTITPRDDDNATKNTNRDTINSWIKNTATNIDKIIDAWTIIADPQDTTQRLSAYADPNTPNHFNDAGMEAIVNNFTL